MLSAKLLKSMASTPPPVPGANFKQGFYHGNGSTQKIVTGVDLLSKPGIVVIKITNGANPWVISDTLHGTGVQFATDNSNAPTYESDCIVEFHDDGFTVGPNRRTNSVNYGYMYWAIAGAPSFDVQSYVGNGASRTIPHNLGTYPQMAWVKPIGSGDWIAYGGKVTPFFEMAAVLNTGAPFLDSDAWDRTMPTTTAWPLGPNASVNASGQEYLIYLFGPSSSDGIVSYGFYDGASGPVDVEIGFDPDLFLSKAMYADISWTVWSSGLGINPAGVPDYFVQLDMIDRAVDGHDWVSRTGSGILINAGNNANIPGERYLWVACKDGG